MAFQVSPGVKAYEIDAPNTVAGVSTSTGAFAGPFAWGPVEEIVTVGSEAELTATFGTPDTTTNKSFLVAANYLMYSQALRVVRAAAGQLNADDAGGGVANALIKNKDDYDASISFPAGSTWAAKYAGALGNAVKVEVCSAGGGFTGWAHAGLFSAAPGTSSFATGLSINSDELHVVVSDDTGAISGTAGTVLEIYAHVSQLADAKKTNGSNNYYKDVLNAQSAWVWWTGHSSTNLTQAGALSTAVTGAMDSHTTVISATMTGGLDDNSPTDGELQTAYNVFANKELVDIDLIIGGSVSPTLANSLVTLAELRKDAVVCLSPEAADVTAALVVAWGNAITKSTYAVLDSTLIKVYDKYNDIYVNIGASGAVAGCMAATDDVADAWFSPAGVARGQIRGVTKLVWNPTQLERDDLYKVSINPIVAIPGQGTMLFGDKTNSGKPSAFDRINVRRLFIAVEKAISAAARGMLFEFNDEFTRSQFKNAVEPFLRDVKGRRGVTDFKVVCDETNNGQGIVDSNQFVAGVYLKPSRSINFITLNFIVSRSGVEFTEISG